MCLCVGMHTRERERNSPNKLGSDGLDKGVMRFCGSSKNQHGVFVKSDNSNNVIMNSCHLAIDHT